jgi:cell division initiation protein
MLTPLDIDNKTFKKSKLGGYDISDVEEFLVVIMEDYEKLYKENSEIKDKLCAMQESVSYYKSIEEGINKTVENAQTQAEEIKELAKKEAENIVKEGELDARKKLNDIKEEIKRSEFDLVEKKKQMDIYKIKVGSMLEAQLKILNEE